MIFYEKQTWIGLGLVSILFMVSLVLQFLLRKEKLAVVVLVIGALALRLLVISLDPFLHDWDERFHAMVAKNMIEQYFSPMLHVATLLSYHYKAWCCNHIWLHKQPLFMWQMALSMKIFGINAVAMRLPSALMGSLSVFFIYRVMTHWTNDKIIAYVAAFLCALSYYQLELSAGRVCTDQNDTAFVFYVSAAIWAYCRYSRSKSIANAMLIGVFTGAAVLNKWLPGLVVYSGWGLTILLDKVGRREIKSYFHFVASVLVSIVVFLPWQLFTLFKFPSESKWEYWFNSQHLFHVVVGHSGSLFYHLSIFSTLYSAHLLVFMVIGIIVVVTSKDFNRKVTISMLTTLLTFYVFYTLVATKMDSFTFPVSIIVFGLTAIGLVHIAQSFKWTESKVKRLNVALLLMVFTFGVICLKPWSIASECSQDNSLRNDRIYNAAIYEALPDSIACKYVIFNCSGLEDVVQMFYKDCNAYQWYPPEEDVNRLIKQGHKIAAYQSHCVYKLPPYLTKPGILIIQRELR